jgi:hypothetical protein
VVLSVCFRSEPAGTCEWGGCMYVYEGARGVEVCVMVSVDEELGWDDTAGLGDLGEDGSGRVRTCPPGACMNLGLRPRMSSRS